MNLTFIGPCIANIFAAYNQQDATSHNLFISVRRCTCFRPFFRPSSGAQNCTHSVRYWSDQYLTLCVQFWAPDDWLKNGLKHAERLTEINKLWLVASCWLHAANILAMDGRMNVKSPNYLQNFAASLLPTASVLFPFVTLCSWYCYCVELHANSFSVALRM